MKKIIIGIISFVLIAASADAQEILDTTMLKCRYKYFYITDTLQHQSREDVMILEIGRNIRKFYSETARLYDSVMKADMQITIGKDNNVTTVRNTKKPSIQRSRLKTVTYFDYPKGKITTFGMSGIDSYEYAEDIENIEWQMFAEGTKEILGYDCQKATCTFRGRNYEVWYAPDIPVNGGLWKFSGLPGLILMANDTQNQFVFTCESIEKISKPIMKNANTDNKKTRKIKRKEFLKIQKRFYEDPMATIGGKIEITNRSDGSQVQIKNLPYNPIELE
jgi:GLPGLI family protein